MAAKTMGEAVELLFHALHHERATNFTSVLFMLMQKSDPENFFRLSMGFPHEAAALTEWKASPDSNEFFERYGLGLQTKSHGT